MTPMAYQVAICDDSEIDAEYVKQILCGWAKDRGTGLIKELKRIKAT